MDTESQSASELPECNNSSAAKVPLCLRFYDCIDQYVHVQLVKDVSYYGFVHSIDPVTKSILLWVPNGDKFKTMLIPGHNVVGLGRKRLPLGVDLKPPTRQKDISHEITSQEMEERKLKLIAWFKFNLLPVAESGDNIVVQTVHVLPPYNSSNIYAENPVITSKIKQIMEKMPSDFVSP